MNQSKEMAKLAYTALSDKKEKMSGSSISQACLYLQIIS